MAHVHDDLVDDAQAQRLPADVPRRDVDDAVAGDGLAAPSVGLVEHEPADHHRADLGLAT